MPTAQPRFILRRAGGNLPLIEVLLKAGAAVDARELMGLTPLWLAAYNGHGDIVELLLKEGADVNGTAHDNSTPLRAARLGKDGRLRLNSPLAKYSWMGFYGSVFGRFSRLEFVLEQHGGRE